MKPMCKFADRNDMLVLSGRMACRNPMEVLNAATLSWKRTLRFVVGAVL